MENKQIAKAVITHTITVENLKFSFYFNGGRSEPPNKVDMLHSHSYYELFAAVDPPVAVHFKGKEEHLYAGELFLIPPNFPHTRLISELNSKNCIAIGISIERINGDFCFDLWKKYKQVFNPLLPMLFENCESLIAVLCNVTDQLRSNLTVGPALRMVEFIDELSEQRATPLTHLAGGNEMKNINTDLSRLIQLEYIIKSRFNLEISTSDIADQLYLSRCQLDRITKRRYGKTLRELLNQKRSDYAANLLLDSDLTLNKIAEESGFGCTASLLRNFQKSYGCTPSRYRMDNKK